jgi:muramoyltetrapeptide carboxypeptidase
MVKIPPYLQPGNTIALVCPSGFMAIEKAQTCINVLQQWGYKVKVGTTVGSHSQNYFSGTDEERLINFQQILDDDEVHAVLCARGGYGLSRIIDHISFKKFKKNPKWVIGFSDITVLHSHIYSNYGIATLHAPMAGAFNDDGYANEFVGSLKQALEGRSMSYECAGHEFNNKGEAIGELVGGNLALLAHLVGTPSDIKTKGRILFIEDVGEYLYNIDRMMRQLQRSGKFDKLAGLIIGGFSDTKDTERPFGQNVYELIHDIVKDYDYPVSFGFPVSHEKENYALKVGVGHRLKVGRSRVLLQEYVDDVD